MEAWAEQAALFCARSGLALLPVWAVLLRHWPATGSGAAGASAALRGLLALAALALLTWLPLLPSPGGASTARLPVLWAGLDAWAQRFASAEALAALPAPSQRLREYRLLLRLRPGDIHSLAGWRPFWRQCLQDSLHREEEAWDPERLLPALPPHRTPLDLPQGAPAGLSCETWWHGSGGWRGLRVELTEELRLRHGEGAGQALLLPLLWGARQPGRSCAWPHAAALCPLVRLLQPEAAAGAMRAAAGFLLALIPPLWILAGAVWSLRLRLLAALAAAYVLAAGQPLWEFVLRSAQWRVQEAALSSHAGLEQALASPAALAALTCAQAMPWTPALALAWALLALWPIPRRAYG